MKQSKLLAVTMAAVLSLTLAGCSSSKPAENNSNTPAVKAMSGEDLNKIEKDDKEKEKHLVIDVRAENEYKEDAWFTILGMHFDFIVDVENSFNQDDLNLDIESKKYR